MLLHYFITICYHEANSLLPFLGTISEMMLNRR